MSYLLIDPADTSRKRFVKGDPLRRVSGGFNAGVYGTLKVWLSDTGASAGTWSDMSGNGNHATQGTAGMQPAIVTNSINGHQVRRFDGTNDYLNGALSVTGTTMTVIAVLSLNSASAAFGRVVSTGATNTADEDNAARAAAILRVGGTSVSAFRGASQKSTGTIVYDTPVIVTSKFDVAMHTLYLNGVAQVAVGSVGTFTISAYRLGASLLDADTGSFFKGDLAEVLAYSDSLTNGNRQTVEAYLAAKYGISI